MIGLPALPAPVVRTGSFIAACAVNRAAHLPGRRCQHGHVFLHGEAAFKRGREQY